MPKLEFNNKAGESEKTISEDDKKIDTSHATEEEQEFIDSLTDNEPINTFNDEMNNEEDDADTSGDDEEESEESDDEEEDEADDDEAESDDEEESEEDDSTETEDESDEDSDTETQTEKGQFDGYDTFEEYKAAQNKGTEANDSEEKDDDYNETVNFLRSHKDIIPEKVVDMYAKFAESKNNAFIHGSNHLHKLNKALELIDSRVPYKQRLESAFQLAFKDDIIKQAQKAAQAKAEIRTQKVDKAAVGPASGSSGSGSTKNKLTNEQRQVFKRMNVPVPKKYN